MPGIPGISGIGTGIWDSFLKSGIWDSISKSGIWDWDLGFIFRIWDLGLVLKIWDLGLGFGIHLQKIRDLGSQIADPWFRAAKKFRKKY